MTAPAWIAADRDLSHHYEGLARYAFESQFLTAETPEYFRHQAAELRGEYEPIAHRNSMPHPADIFEPTADDMDEMADELECDMERGEFI